MVCQESIAILDALLRILPEHLLVLLTLILEYIWLHVSKYFVCAFGPDLYILRNVIILNH